MRTPWLALALGAALAPTAMAQTPGDTLMDTLLARETRRLSGRVFDGARNLDEWQQRRPRLRREYLDMLGLWPLPERTPLHDRVTGTVERGDIVIEKLHFQSRPGLYVTGNLYRPKASAGRLPAVLYVCGHSGRGRDGNKTAFQDHGMWFARHGYVCLVVDTLQLGEVAGIHHGTYREGRWWWQARGYTPAGVECWNSVRALDYLAARSDVDPEKLAVTGISGGGAATFWIAAADERVKCAVPVSGMSDLESYVTNKVINGHCDCMFLVNTYGWEWTTIAALVAPRPMLFANSDNDRIFPMDGNRRIIARLRELYNMHGKADLVDEYVSVGGHDYRPDLRLAIFRWINKHIKNDTKPIEDAKDSPLPGRELRVFPADEDLPKDAINRRVDETFVPTATVSPPTPAEFTAWRDGLVKALRERSFRSLPDRVPAAEPGKDGAVLTEPGLELALRPVAGGDGRTLQVLGADDDTPLAGADYLLAPRGVGATRWTAKSPPNYVERAHALLGRTVDEGRVWDVIATVRRLAATKPADRGWRVVGRGRAGMLAVYAALLEPTIGEVMVVDPPASHRNGPIFLNVLRVLDVPDALGLLAPRPVTLVGAKSTAFDRTEEIYRRAGVPEKLTRK